MTDRILGRDDILNADDIQPVPVPVEEWGGTVLVKPLTGNERDAYEAANWRRGKGGLMEFDTRGSRARLAQLAMVDEKGGKLFTRDDIRALGQKSAVALDRVVEAAREAGGIDENQIEDRAESFDERTDETEVETGALSGASSF